MTLKLNQKKGTKGLEEFECNFCDDTFTTKRNLMNHNKREHLERLANCWKFATGACQYGNYCWFSHEHIDQEPKEINCNRCEKVFITPSEFHMHSKQNHKQFLPTCRNASNGNCKYGDLLCWFKHDVNAEGLVDQEKAGSYNQEVFEKLFIMIDKISERVINIEQVK